jgi:hypothetical protein
MSGTALILLAAAAATAQEPVAPATPAVAPVAAPDEVIVFQKPNYRGDWMRLKVGDELPNLTDTPAGNWERRISSVKVGAEAVAVLYSSFEFQRFCLGLPGTSFGGAGYYPDLDRVKNKSLRNSLDDNTRSLRVLGKGTDLSSVCTSVQRK